jgi:hypothetical protein
MIRFRVLGVAAHKRDTTMPISRIRGVCVLAAAVWAEVCGEGGGSSGETGTGCSRGEGGGSLSGGGWGGTPHPDTRNGGALP